MYIISQLLNGLQLGAIYALIAIGYTMVYGIVKLINFAHGDIMMAGAYFVLLLLRSGVPLLVAIPIAMLACAVLGMTIDQIAYKPLRHSTRLSALITAIGVSLLLQNVFMLVFSPDPEPFPDFISALPVIRLGANQINSIGLITIAVAVIIMILLHLFVRRTRIGQAMRAVSEDYETASLMGINVNKTISITFAIGSALAALAAAFYVISYQLVDPYMGSLPGLKAFIAAVLGGIGILPGAMLGGFVLGLAEGLTKAVIPSELSQLSDAVVYLILIIVLLVKPTGLLGRSQSEKV